MEVLIPIAIMGVVIFALAAPICVSRWDDQRRRRIINSVRLRLEKVELPS